MQANIQGAAAVEEDAQRIQPEHTGIEKITVSNCHICILHKYTDMQNIYVVIIYNNSLSDMESMEKGRNYRPDNNK